MNLDVTQSWNNFAVSAILATYSVLQRLIIYTLLFYFSIIIYDIHDIWFFLARDIFFFCFKIGLVSKTHTQKGSPVVRATHDSTMASCVKLRYLMKPGEMLSKGPSHSPTDIYLYAYVLDLTQSDDIGHAQICCRWQIGNIYPWQGRFMLCLSPLARVNIRGRCHCTW